MKKSLLLVLAAVTFTAAAFSQVAHWPLDTDTRDVVGVNHGTPSLNGVSFVDDAERGVARTSALKAVEILLDGDLPAHVVNQKRIDRQAGLGQQALGILRISSNRVRIAVDLLKRNRAFRR